MGLKVEGVVIGGECSTGPLIPRYQTAGSQSPATGSTPPTTAAGPESSWSTAGEVLRQAAQLVSGDRERTHGDKLDNFAKAAVIWNAYLEIRRNPDAPLDAFDVAEMMSLFKKVRKQCGAYNPDDYVDDPGYAGCGAEIKKRLG